MIDITMALEGLKGLKETMPRQLKAINFEGKGIQDAIEFSETMDIAISAVRKHIPVKSAGDLCGKCGADIRPRSRWLPFNYCPDCGQKLDWED